LVAHPRRQSVQERRPGGGVVHGDDEAAIPGGADLQTGPFAQDDEYY
jgi:hypothetical protein